MNVVVLLGTLSRAPETRTLTSGDRLVRLELTTRDGDGPARTTPVVWIEPPSSAPDVGAGDAVLVVGRVRRRFFRAGGVTQSRTEVEAESVVPARHAARCRRAVERLAAGLSDDLEAGLGS